MHFQHLNVVNFIRHDRCTSKTTGYSFECITRNWKRIKRNWYQQWKSGNTTISLIVLVDVQQTFCNSFGTFVKRNIFNRDKEF